jgi:hypothetical protein
MTKLRTAVEDEEPTRSERCGMIQPPENMVGRGDQPEVTLFCDALTLFVSKRAASKIKPGRARWP